MAARWKGARILGVLWSCSGKRLVRIGRRAQVKPPNLELHTSSARRELLQMRDVLEEASTGVLFAQNCNVGQSPQRADDRVHVALLCRPPTERVHNMRLRPKPVNDHPAVTPGNRNQLCAACLCLRDCCLCEVPSTSLFSFFIYAISKNTPFRVVSRSTTTATKSWRPVTNPSRSCALRDHLLHGLQLAPAAGSHPHRPTSPAA
jgi:hypothetical protein